MSQTVSSAAFFNVAGEIANEVGQFQIESLKGNLEIEFKGDINLVTQIDKKSEEMIVAAIQKAFPEHDILAEEGTGGDRKDSDYKWIIDPLDGTTNFTHRYPLFAVSIALEYQGQIVGGLVHDPNRPETFKAFRGEGAFLNDQKISVTDAPTLDRAMMATGFAYNIRETENNNLNHFSEVIMKAQAVRRDGVAAIDLCYVACGRYDGYWELNLFPWDTAAGLVILEEAGGRITRFDGTPYSVYEKDLLATNGKIHDEMVTVLKPNIVRHFG